MKFIIFLAIFVIMFIIMHAIHNKKESSNNESLKLYLMSPYSTLYAWVMNEIDNLNEDIGFTSEKSFISTYIDTSIQSVYNKLINKVDTDGVDWVGIPGKFINPEYSDYVQENFKNIIIESANEILNGQTVKERLTAHFITSIRHNIKKAYDIEQNAINYNNKFGEEPDGEPELHPAEINIGSNDSSDIDEKSIEELSTTGTVEDIE